MEIYIKESDMPIVCTLCSYYTDFRCMITNQSKWKDSTPKDCPLKSLEQHDKEVIKEFGKFLHNRMSTLLIPEAEGIVDLSIIEEWEIDGLVDDFLEEMTNERI